MVVCLHVQIFRAILTSMQPTPFKQLPDLTTSVRRLAEPNLAKIHLLENGWNTPQNFPLHLMCSKEKQCTTFKTLEWLKDLNECLGRQLFVILGGNLDADLEVLANVGLQHCFNALERVLDRQWAEVVHQPLGIQQVSVHDRSLYVVQVRVVLQRLRR